MVLKLSESPYPLYSEHGGLTRFKLTNSMTFLNLNIYLYFDSDLQVPNLGRILLLMYSALTLYLFTL